MLDEKIAKLAPRERIVLAAGGAVLMVLVIVGVAVLPVRRWFAEAAHDRVVLRETIASKQKIIAWEPSLRHDLEQCASYMPIRKGSPSEVRAELLGAIESAATTTGVTLMSTKPRDPRTREIIEEYTVELEIESGMSDLLKFMHEIYSSAQLLRVDKLAVSPKSDSTDTKSAILKGTLLVSREVML